MKKLASLRATYLTAALCFLVSGCSPIEETSTSDSATSDGLSNRCGNQVCGRSESCSTCPEDCGQCAKSVDGTISPSLYTVTVTSPAAGATVAGTVDIVGAAPGLVNVEVFSSADVKLASATPDGNGAFTTPLDTAALPNGDQTLVVRGWNSAPGAPFTQMGDTSLVVHVANSVTTPPSTASPTPGPSLVAIDTPKRTVLGYVTVPVGGWTPTANGWPKMATWDGSTTYSALRFQSFKPGDVLTPAQIIALLPRAAQATKTIDITAAPYNAKVAPADATTAIQAALDAAKAMATPTAPVDVLVPAGTFNYSAILEVGADVRLRRFPEATGGVLNATNETYSAVHLAGDRSGALFLKIVAHATSRNGLPDSSGVWTGGRNASSPFIHDPLVVGTEVVQVKGAHMFGMAEEGGLWAFNYVHDGFADSYHHTGRSRYCQVIGNRTQVSSTRGDDFYPFVGYAGDGDPVHHCTCIANWGRDGHARGLAVVGAGFIHYQDNDIARTQWAGIYIAQETSYDTFGSFDITVEHNTVSDANLGGSHDGLIAFSDAPGGTKSTQSFGTLSNQIRRVSITNNTFKNTSLGVGNGFGIELRDSVDTITVTGNTLAGNRSPQLVTNGSNISISTNTLVP